MESRPFPRADTAAAASAVPEVYEASDDAKSNIYNVIPFDRRRDLLGPKLFFVTGLVIFVTAVARLVCPDLLG